MQEWEQAEAYERNCAGHTIAEISEDLHHPPLVVRFAIKVVRLSGVVPAVEEYLPSQEEIRRKTSEIRAGWSRKTEVRRRVVKPLPFEFPVMAERDLPLDLGLDPIRLIDESA